MSEEIALACADLETVRQLRAALAVALAENDGWHAYEKAVAARMEEWQSTASQALRAALLAEDALKHARAEIAFLREWLRGECTISDVEIDAALKNR